MFSNYPLKSNTIVQDWFETHQAEGVRVNVVGTLNVVDCCHQLGIHCTIFGTGFVYNYDQAHPLGSGIAFKVRLCSPLLYRR